MEVISAVQVKVSFNDELRRFSLLRDASFQQLSDNIITICNIDPLAGVVIKYVDSDEDLITMTCDAELREAIRVLKDGSLLRLTVSAKGTPVSLAKPSFLPPVSASAPALAPVFSHPEIQQTMPYPALEGELEDLSLRAGAATLEPSTAVVTQPALLPAHSEFVPYGRGHHGHPGPQHFGPWGGFRGGFGGFGPHHGGPGGFGPQRGGFGMMMQRGGFHPGHHHAGAGFGPHRGGFHPHHRVPHHPHAHPYGFGPHGHFPLVPAGLSEEERKQWKEAQKEQWKAQREQWKAQRKAWKEGWKNMSEEDREAFKQHKKEMKHHFKAEMEAKRAMRACNQNDREHCKKQKKEMKRAFMAEWMTAYEQQTGIKFDQLDRDAFKMHKKEMKRLFRAEREDKCGKRATGEKLLARHVKDVTIADGTELPPSTPFVKTWKLRNEGEGAWPAGSRLLFISRKGDRMGGPDSVAIAAEGVAVEPGQEVEISVNLVAPSEPGRYTSYYKLVTPEGFRFGQRLWASIVVTGTSSSSSSSSDEDKKETKYGPTADMIQAMGFDVKRKHIVRMLAKHDNNADRVVGILAKKEKGCKKNKHHK